MSIRGDVDYSSFSRYLREASRAASPEMKRKYFKNAGALILRMEAGIFKSDGADLAGRWKPLSPVTLARRKKSRKLVGKRASGMQILRDTRILEQSVGGGTAERGPTGSIREIRPLELKIGTRIDYARSHQYGLPARMGHVKEKMRRGYNVRGHRVAARGVLPHSYKTKSGKIVNVSAYTIRSHSVRAHGVLPGKVKAHDIKLPAVPARPFVGWTNWGVEAVVMEAYRHFAQGPDERTR